MPTVKTAGKRRSIGRARAKDPLRLRWIRARAREHGFALWSEPELRVERVRIRSGADPLWSQRLHVPGASARDRCREVRLCVRQGDRTGTRMGLRDDDSDRHGG